MKCCSDVSIRSESCLECIVRIVLGDGRNARVDDNDAHDGGTLNVWIPLLPDGTQLEVIGLRVHDPRSDCTNDQEHNDNIDELHEEEHPKRRRLGLQ